jgi:hypothetical protein
MSDSYQAVKAQTCRQVIEQLEAQGATAEALDKRTLRAEIEQVADDLVDHVDGKNIIHPAGGWAEVARQDWERYPGW